MSTRNAIHRSAQRRATLFLIRVIRVHPRLIHLLVPLAVCLLLATTAFAQLRDSFETPT